MGLGFGSFERHLASLCLRGIRVVVDRRYVRYLAFFVEIYPGGEHKGTPEVLVEGCVVSGCGITRTE